MLIPGLQLADRCWGTSWSVWCPGDSQMTWSWDRDIWGTLTHSCIFFAAASDLGFPFWDICCSEKTPNSCKGNMGNSQVFPRQDQFSVDVITFLGRRVGNIVDSILPNWSSVLCLASLPLPLSIVYICLSSFDNVVLRRQVVTSLFTQSVKW